MEFWKRNLLFTWRWWITVGFLVIPWIVWLLVRKKDSTYRLLGVYLFIVFLSAFVDGIGTSLRLWSYPVPIHPLVACLPYSYSVLPIVTMLFLQFFPKVKPVYKALLYAALGTFVFQPVCIGLGLVNHEKWPDYYTFPVLFVFYLAANWLATRKNYDPLI